MMSSDSNSKGGEGRGLPVGVEWYCVEGTDGAVLLPTEDPDDTLAAARADGTWDVWSKGHSRRLAKGTAQPRPGETLLAAAQAAAEAALWRRDGFGVGEVRGLPLPAILPYKQTPTALPGLAGLWRVTRWALASIGEGVEVDAVRAPVPARCPACGAILPATGIGCESCGWMGEPLPGDDERAPVEPATREPSVPTDDDELARLLRGPDGARLDDDIATVRNHAPEIWSGTREHVLRVARACELLLAERAVLARSFGDALKREDRAFGLRVAFEQGRATERARIAELEAALAAEKEAHQACHAERVRYHDTAARLEAERLAASATPPPHTVAALLARVEAEAVPDRSTWRDYTRGLNKAADIIRATLTPSPLDGVVADVLACDVAAELANGEQGMLVAVDMLNADLFHGNAAGHKVTLRKLGAIALRYIAGMLACDAAKGGDK